MRLAHQVGSALVEVLQGRRTPANLAAVMDDDVYATVEHLARGGLGSELRLRGVRAQMPSPGVVRGLLALRDGASRTHPRGPPPGEPRRALAAVSGPGDRAHRRRRHARPWQFLNFFPDPHGHGLLRPTFAKSSASASASSPDSFATDAWPDSSGPE